ncbi:MAG: hypothetical protein ABIZ49_00045 [Opitutaceae bacterium]
MSDYWKEIEATSSPAPASTAEFLVPTNAKLLRQIGAAAVWVWVFAAFSVVNLILAYLRGPIRMSVSLFFTELGFEFGRAAGPGLTVVALLLDAFVIGGVVVLGFLVKRGFAWAFFAGIILLTGDAVLIYFLTTLAGVWPFILHSLAIYFLVLGWKAAKINRVRKANGQI